MCALKITTVALSYLKKCFIDKYMFLVLSEVIEKSTRSCPKSQTEAWRVCFRCKGEMLAFKGVKKGCHSHIHYA